jgi:hypothetical protein
MSLVLRRAATVLAAGLLIAACSSSADSQSAQHQRVLFAPEVAGGVGGWCMALADQKCVVAAAGDGLIVGVGVVGDGRSPGRQIIVLVRQSVRAIQVDGGKSVKTYAETTLPQHLRVAVVDEQGDSSSCFSSVERCGAMAPRIVGFNIDGDKVVVWSNTHQEQLFFVVPARAWTKTPPAGGACTIMVRGLDGVSAVEGAVVEGAKPRAALLPGETIACASTVYRFAGQNFFASFLVDAQRPGTGSISLPEMKWLPRLGVYEVAHVATGELIEGPALTRRVSGGWLAVAGGRNNRQRLTLLEHLRSVSILAGTIGSHS